MMYTGEEAFSDWNVLSTDSKQNEADQAKASQGISGFLERGKAHFYNLYQRGVPSALRLSSHSDFWLLGVRYPPTSDRTDLALAHLSVRGNATIFLSPLPYNHYALLVFASLS